MANDIVSAVQNTLAGAGFPTSKLSLQNTIVANASSLASGILKGVFGQGNSNSNTLTPGARDVLGAARSRADPLMSFCWYCDLPVLIDGTQLGWQYVEECTLPFVDFEQQSYSRAGKKFHYAGAYSLGTLTLKCYEDINGSVTQYIQSWKNSILDDATGLFRNPSDYKKTINVTVIDVAKQTVMFFKYLGCWPMRPDSFNMNSGASDRITPSIEFSVDDVLITFGRYPDSAKPSIVNALTTTGFQFPLGLGSLPIQLPSAFTNVATGLVSNGLQSIVGRL